jgi:hypothetical protein
MQIEQELYYLKLQNDKLRVDMEEIQVLFEFFCFKNNSKTLI